MHVQAAGVQWPGEFPHTETTDEGHATCKPI